MSKTNEIRKLIASKLTNEEFVKRYGIKSVSYENADDDKVFPHIVFTLENINLGDLSRHDAILTIDIWDKSDSDNLAEDITDEIEKMFWAQNMPQNLILPTFFLENRRSVKDEDKKIRHKQLEISIQNYER